MGRQPRSYGYHCASEDKERGSTAAGQRIVTVD
jgi:hypothetical protein